MEQILEPIDTLLIFIGQNQTQAEIIENDTPLSQKGNF